MNTKERLIQELEQAPEELLEAALKFILNAKENSNQTPTANPITSEQTDMPVNGIQAMLDLLDSMPLTPEQIASLPHDGAENPGANQTIDKAAKTGKSIWQIAEDFVKDLPETELAKLPADGAQQHDHYIYGTPKIDS